MSAKPSELCLTCRDCDGRGYSSPDPCARCHGRGWLAFNTKCGAEWAKTYEDPGMTFLHRCNREPWHEGEHAESGTVNDGTFYNPRYREYRIAWPQTECTAAGTEIEPR